MRALLAAIALTTCTAMVCGCGSSSTLASAGPPGSSSLGFQGVVMAGGVPAAGASVQLYAAATTGYAATASALLFSGVTTGSAGTFTIAAGSYTCPSTTSQLYLLAQGSGTHAAMSLLDAVGTCSAVTSGEFFTVNEVTTSGFVWAMVPFMSAATNIGSSSTNAVGLANAFTTAQLLTDSGTGRSPATSIASGVVVESAKVYSLANSLAPCAATASCTALFAATTIGSSIPTNTADAMLAVVKHPTANVTEVYQAGASAPVFSGLAVAPSDWTMSVASTGGSLSDASNVAIDSTGRAWVPSYTGKMEAFTMQGAAVFATPLTSVGWNEGIGVTVDPSDNVWVTNGSGDGVLKFSSSGTLLSPAVGYTGGGIRFPTAVASDISGNIWVVSNGNSSVTKLSNSGVPVQSTGYTAGGALSFGLTVAVDSNATPWIATADGTAVHLTSSGALITSSICCAIADGIAIAVNNDPWVADEYGSAVVHLAASTGAIASSTTTGGVDEPTGVAVDSSGKVWAANSFNGSLTEVNSSGVALSPSIGLGNDAKMQQPEGVALDSSGSIWVVSNADNRLVRFIGLAAPIKTPLVSSPVLP